MKLYHSKGACSLAVKIIINELGIPCDYEAVNLKTKETETGDNFLNINPKGSVPVLQLDNNEILTENAVIQQYLADKYQANTLLPAINSLQRYRVLEWLNYVSTELHKNCSPLFNPMIPDNLKDEIFRPILKKKLAIVDTQLQGREFLMGDQFTLPDSYLFVILTWMHALKMDITIWPDLSRYFIALKLRPSIQKALQ